MSIRPHPAVVVRADATIADCVRVMKENNIGAVLVRSDDGKDVLVGIFTERDLLKNIKLVDEGKHLEKPVRTVMTKPVKTIDRSEIHTALEVMIENGFRHLPVMDHQPDGTPYVAGVISMRDLMKQLKP